MKQKAKAEEEVAKMNELQVKREPERKARVSGRKCQSQREEKNGNNG